MSERKAGWYHVRTGVGPECAKWNGEHWIIAGSMHSYDDSDFVGIGGRIPAPDEPWQCVPAEMTAEMRDALSSILGGVDGMFDEAYGDMLAAAPNPGGE